MINTNNSTINEKLVRYFKDSNQAYIPNHYTPGFRPDIACIPKNPSNYLLHRDAVNCFFEGNPLHIIEI